MSTEDAMRQLQELVNPSRRCPVCNMGVSGDGYNECCSKECARANYIYEGMKELGLILLKEPSDWAYSV